MKIFFSLTVVFASLFLKAEPLKCESTDFLMRSKPALQFFREFSSAAMALGMAPGDKIKTSMGQTTTLHFFKPTDHTIMILENSVVEMRAPTISDCQGALLISKGHLVSEGEHGAIQKNKKCFKQAEIETPSAEVIPRGTKYSVDLNSAIAEANGEQITETEAYAVEKGSIQIKLKKVKPNIKSQNIVKNETIRLKAGQKAKIKINQKTKFADIEVIDP